MIAAYGYVHRRELGAADVAALIRDFVAEGYCLLEKLTDASLDRLDAARMAELDLADGLGLQGRAFSASAEVRWRRSPAAIDRFEVMVLAEKEQVLGSNGEWQRIVFDETHVTRQVLWGQWDGRHWVEARIPRPQRYPVSGSASRPLAHLTSIEYRQNGITRLTRFTGVEAIAEAGR